MALSEYDRAHIGDILGGQGDWFTARLLRALDTLLPHADADNRAKIESTWPNEAAALFAYYNPKNDALSDAFPGLAKAAEGIATLGGK